MNYTIFLSEDGHYIVVKIVGIIDRKSALKPLLESHALGRKHSIRRYLEDLTEAISADSPAEKFAFANTDIPNAEGIDPSARVSILVSVDDHSHDFMETVARNAGLSVTLFRDSAQAIHNLIHDIEPLPKADEWISEDRVNLGIS